MPGEDCLCREHVKQIQTIGPAGWSQKTIGVRSLNLRGCPGGNLDPRREVSGCNRNDKNACDRTRQQTTLTPQRLTPAG